MTADPMLTVPQVAERLACSPTTVRSFITSKHKPLPAVKRGAFIRVPQSALDAWLEQHTTGATALRRVS